MSTLGRIACDAGYAMHKEHHKRLRKALKIKRKISFQTAVKVNPEIAIQTLREIRSEYELWIQGKNPSKPAWVPI